MIKRHIAFKQKYPDRPAIHGKPYEGIENLRPESKKIVEFFYLACHKNRALTRTEPRAGRIANYDR
jgi:hypothetical protein